MTGAPLQIYEEDRQALNDPATAARTIKTAYVPAAKRAFAGRQGSEPDHADYAGAAWAKRHGMELLPASGAAAGVPR